MTSINQICITFKKELNLTSIENNKISTGFADLDNLLCEGLEKKPNLICLAAQVGMGKTLLLLDIALNVAMSSGKDVYIFSLQFSKEQIVDMLLTKLSGIYARHIFKNNGELTDDMKYKIVSALSALSELKIFICDDHDMKFNDIKSKIKNIDNTALIIIDFIRLMTITDGSKILSQEQRAIADEKLVNDLSTLSKEINTPIIAEVHLQRFTAERKDRRPLLSDLSLQAFQSVPDTVIMLYRDYQDGVRHSWTRGFGNDVLSNETELLVHKNRYGSLGKIKLDFNNKYFRFESKNSPES